MLNNVTNIIEIEIEDLGGTKLSEVRDVLLNENNHVDFEKITPMPDCLKDFIPYRCTTAFSEVKLNLKVSENPSLTLWQEVIKDKVLENEAEMSDKDRGMLECAINCYWFEWSFANWGTKWNAYHQQEDGNAEGETEFIFDTACYHPVPIIDKLSRMLPDVTFLVKYADEKLGTNCGSYSIKGGEHIHFDIAPYWPDMTDEEERKWAKFASGLLCPDTDPRSFGYPSPT